MTPLDEARMHLSPLQKKVYDAYDNFLDGSWEIEAMVELAKDIGTLNAVECRQALETFED